MNYKKRIRCIIGMFTKEVERTFGDTEFEIEDTSISNETPNYLVIWDMVKIDIYQTNGQITMHIASNKECTKSSSMVIRSLNIFSDKTMSALMYAV